MKENEEEIIPVDYYMSVCSFCGKVLGTKKEKEGSLSRYKKSKVKVDGDRRRYVISHSLCEECANEQINCY